MLGTEATLSRAPARSGSITSSTTVTASVVNTTETLLFTKTIPANTLAPGDVLRLELFGRITTGTANTLNLRIRWGGLAGTLLLATGDLTPFENQANSIFHAVVLITVRSTTSFYPAAVGVFPWDPTGLTATGGSFAFGMASSGGNGYNGNAAAVTVASNADKDLVATVQWGGNNPTNAIAIDGALLTKHVPM